MTNPHRVDDPSDARLAPFLRLTDRVLRDAPAATYVAESLLVVDRVLRAGAEVRTIAVIPAAASRLVPALEAHARSGRPAPEVLVVERAVLAAVAGFDVHRGVLAEVVRPPEADVARVVEAAAGRAIAVVEGVVDQANLGAIFRNAAGLGVGAVVLCPRCCDPLYRRTVRVSMGAVLDVPWARAPRWPDELTALTAAGYRLVALTPSGRPLAAPWSATAPRSTLRAPVAVLLGSEGDGLSAEVLARADERVSIPMSGAIDSLNVAAASAIAFWAFAEGAHP